MIRLHFFCIYASEVSYYIIRKFDKDKFCLVRSRISAKPLAPAVEAIKQKANEVFEMQKYNQAILLYNEAIHMANNVAILYGNRAAAYMKRNW